MGRAWGGALRRLVESGLVTGDAVVEGRVSIDHLSRSNEVGLVRVDDVPTLVLKRTALALDGVDPHDAELAAYRFLAAQEATESLAPRLMLSADDGVLVFEAIDAPSLHEALAASPDPAELLRDLGRCLATLHRAPPAGDLPRRRPWVLAVPERSVPGPLTGDGEIVAMVEEIAGDRLLLESFDWLTRAWRPQAMTHGDVKFDNVLAGRDGMRLIDWELAGLGLPSWDLAGIVDGLVVPGLVGLDERDPWALAEAASPAVEAYVLAFGATEPPASVSEVLHASVVRLVQSAIQLLAMRHGEPSVTSGAARQVLDGARSLAHRLARTAVPT